jgi:parallel beta-helix repeat protein
MKRALSNGLVLFMLSGVAPLMSAPLSEAELNAAIKESIAKGGGEIVLPPGTIAIEKGLRFENAKNLRILGSPGDVTVLKLPPIAYAITREPAAVGADRILVAKQQGFRPGMTLHIETEGEIDSFTKQPKPYVLAKIKAMEEGVLILEQGLRFPVPAETLIRDPHAPNLIEIREGCDSIHLENLVIDGGRVNGDPPVRTHAQLCGVFVQGRYSYEMGPTGPKPSQISLVNCLVRNCHGRGVALYSAENCEIRGNRFHDLSDEAIDLDHFAVRIRVIDNEIRRAPIGIEMNDASDCLIEGNRVYDCRGALHLWQFCKLPGLNEGNRIVRNRFEGFRGKAIQIQEHLTKNTVEENVALGQ